MMGCHKWATADDSICEHACIIPHWHPHALLRGPARVCVREGARMRPFAIEERACAIIRHEDSVFARTSQSNSACKRCCKRASSCANTHALVQGVTPRTSQSGAACTLYQSTGSEAEPPALESLELILLVSDCRCLRTRKQSARLPWSPGFLHWCVIRACAPGTNCTPPC